MAAYYSWSGGSGLPANVWDDAANFDGDYSWTKFWFASTSEGVAWNNARCINLLIARCNWLEAQIEGQAPAELTWQAIAEAWIKNDFEGRGVTIAVIDRMRQIIWDEPFFVQWASRPEQQEF